MSVSQVQRLKASRLTPVKLPGKNSTESTQAALLRPTSSAKSSKKKAKKTVNILVAIKPVNLQTERAKFFDSDCKYDPQFSYLSDDFDCSRINSECTGPSAKYLPQALKIIQKGLKIFGSYSSWESISGGRIMTREEVTEYVTNYLESVDMLDEIKVNITPFMLSHASMTRVKGCPTLNIRDGVTHRYWIEGMLNHEVGTHYLRAYNNKLQPWKTRKKRKRHRLLPPNPTEEGLASLNTQINRDRPILLRSALMYLAVLLASKFSFSRTYAELRRFIDNPDMCWNYVTRAKRGQTDTSLPGCFFKDQVYLTGSLQILANRRNINFASLYRLGKVSYKDVSRLERKAKISGTRLPNFLLDTEQYKRRLDFIVQYNGLTDEDFLDV